MGFVISLDEVETKALARETLRRFKLRLKGLCDYCGRQPTTPSCKFPERHNPKPQKAARS